MGKLNVTRTEGREWWLERISDKGRQRYPRVIRVGEHGKEQVYLPSRKCRNTASPYGDSEGSFACSSCGYTLKDAGKSYLNGIHLISDFKYCPYCGAEIEDSNWF